MNAILSLLTFIIAIIVASARICPPIPNKDCRRCARADDSQIATFDGTYYDQHTIDQCFKYVTYCPHFSSPPFPFEICGCQYDEQGTSTIGDVSIQFFGTTSATYHIEIDHENPTVTAKNILNPDTPTPLISGFNYTFNALTGDYFVYALSGTRHMFAIRSGKPAFEDAWENAGETRGIQIWRIENFSVNAWPADRYGEFYTGDSYIILHTKIDDNDEKTYDLFYWLGAETTEDEAATAAYKTAELNEYLGDEPVQYKEEQGAESKGLMNLFAQITILSGGINHGVASLWSSGYYGYVTYAPGDLQIVLSTDFYRLSCGLCGYFNGDGTDDFLGSDDVNYMNSTLYGLLEVSPTPSVVTTAINDFADSYVCDLSPPICGDNKNSGPGKQIQCKSDEDCCSGFSCRTKDGQKKGKCGRDKKGPKEPKRPKKPKKPKKSKAFGDLLQFEDVQENVQKNSESTYDNWTWIEIGMVLIIAINIFIVICYACHQRKRKMFQNVVFND